VVGCLSENAIQELVAGALSGDARVQAQRHIETCAECRTLVVELARDGDVAATGTPATLPANVASSLPTRDLAERFEIVRPLGRGGMGVVYEALDRRRGGRVALKTLQHVSADGLLRFKTEFRALQDVQHPNVVTFGELIEAGGQWWLTMELVEGAAFLDHVRPGGRLDERRLRAALPQLAAALSALHTHGLVHRDVKPHNVLVTPAGRVVLLDFGLVASVAQSESNVVGTPAYMAPEQALLQEIGPAADWYAVGALLYEALTGALPFQGAPLQVLIAKQHELPRRPGELASVPDDLDALCMQLLAVDPAVRLGAIPTLAGLDPGAAAASPPAALAPSPVFVGRQRELVSLTGAFGDTRAGAGAIVLVDGESGIGKTALVGQFLRGLHERAPAVVVLAGRCYERETVPYKGVDGVVDTSRRSRAGQGACQGAASERGTTAAPRSRLGSRQALSCSRRLPVWRLMVSTLAKASALKTMASSRPPWRRFLRPIEPRRSRPTSRARRRRGCVRRQRAPCGARRRNASGRWSGGLSALPRVAPRVVPRPSTAARCPGCTRRGEAVQADQRPDSRVHPFTPARRTACAAGPPRRAARRRAPWPWTSRGRPACGRARPCGRAR